MAIETVTIDGQQYWIHQLESSYASDCLGNPHYLGFDYLADDIVVLPPRVNEEGNIYYTHEKMEYLEDEFIAYCRVELKADGKPVSVAHLNGDKFDSTPENLEFIYSQEMY